MPLTFANKITLTRILVVPVFIIAVLSYSPEHDYLRYLSLGLFVFAALSDILDGHIARTRHQKTEVGAILDPIADKFLLMSAFICLYVAAHNFPVMNFPLWLVVAVISRDVMLVVGSVLVFMFTGQLKMTVSVWGKGATFFQGLCVMGLLLQLSWTSFIWYIAFVFTVISGVDYFLKGFYLLNTTPLKN